MRLINRKEFMTLPPGTLFSKSGGCYAFTGENIQILDNTMPETNDFISTVISLAPKDYETGACELMDGKRVDSEISSERDGMFEGDDVQFLIYDKSDFDRLMDALSYAKPE